MMFAPLPRTAAWWHLDARDGFEVVLFGSEAQDIGLRGHTVAVEDGRVWSVGYDITLDRRWHTRRAQVWALSLSGERQVTLEADGSGAWQVNGSPRPDLEGCLDVDLESSACTNTIPIHRMRLGVRQQAGAPAAYVRALDLAVERLEQHYARVGNVAATPDVHQRYDYRAPAFDFECRLIYDESGLILEYPGIASRAR